MSTPVIIEVELIAPCAEVRLINSMTIVSAAEGWPVAFAQEARVVVGLPSRVGVTT